jgi:hypothetical protein
MIVVVFMVVFLVVSSLEFPSGEIHGYLCQRDLDNEREAQWTKSSERGTFLGLGRSRGRELVENRDNCRRMPMGCGIF